jgi:hypothetical protein
MPSRTWLRQQISATSALKAFAVLACALLCSPTLPAASPKEPPAQTVDSGSFGVFMNGKRVATETFSIHQSSTGSLVTSEFKTESGVEKAAQSSELQLSPNGDLQSYQWKETSPGESHALVFPNQEFLTERFSKSAQDKPLEHPGRLFLCSERSPGVEISGDDVQAGGRPDFLSAETTGAAWDAECACPAVHASHHAVFGQGEGPDSRNRA